MTTSRRGFLGSLLALPVVARLFHQKPKPVEYVKVHDYYFKNGLHVRTVGDQILSVDDNMIYFSKAGSPTSMSPDPGWPK
jgi:hypothetical protein